MKIVSRKEFLSLPKGTVYSNYEPCIFGELNVKVSDPEEDDNDFVLVPLIDGFVKGSYDNNVSHKELDNFEFDLTCSVRDGLYDDNELFAVYDKNDILKLVAKLTYSFLEEDADDRY